MKAKMSTISCCCLAVILAAGTAAQDAGDAAVDPALELVPANTLDELFKNVEDRRVVENREHVRREREFLQRKDEQQRMLDNARAERRREEQRSERLETKFEENEILIGERQEG